MAPSGKDAVPYREVEHLADEHRRALRGEAFHGEELNRAILTLPPDALEVRIAENRPALYQLVYGAAHHELYHAGQIAILRKG